jgi:VIT1/CCC1 family predicted Fe2+/Mn2+ transporter
MDPLTLFALANGAVSAVKAGCKLYKDIKGAAGEVKDVLKDLDSQFHKLYEGKPVPPEAKKQLQEEKARVVELNKKANADEHTGIYTEIGNHLGVYYDNFYKCIAVFEEEERRAKKEVYTGDDSLGKRALQRVLMRKQLQQMEVDLRELMVYQSPKELGALYTEVEEMMVKMGKEQKVLITQQIQRQAIEAKRKAAKRKQLNIQFAWGIGVLIIVFFFFFIMMLVAQSRQEMYPQYGNGFFPTSEEERRREAQPYVYVGR